MTLQFALLDSVIIPMDILDAIAVDLADDGGVVDADEGSDWTVWVGRAGS
ncbi:hypothetical protein FAM22021_002048 [Propionibacterium freudenreichii]|nr:hypothetical protein [Propionibacterium freudenreichii]